VSPKPETAESCRVALVGVPNCGKTALFNRLTGSRQKVANYPGVTVERKEGQFHSADRRRHYQLIDLPGTYSLVPATLDEAITRDVINGKLRNEAAPDLIVCVVDATNLKLSLRLVLELRRLNKPMIVALNMSDLAHSRGYQLDRARLESELGLPVVETVAVAHSGVRELVAALDAMRGAQEVERMSAQRAADEDLVQLASTGRHRVLKPILRRQGPVVVTNHHFFPGLIAPTHGLSGIGIGQVRRRVVVAGLATQRRPLGQ